jgi:hypothetical protein
MGYGWGVGSDPGFFGTVGRAADDILGGGLFSKENSRTRDWYGNWQKEFPPRLRKSFRPPPEPIIQDSDFRLNLYERQKRATELHRVQREMFGIENGGVGDSRRAWKDTYAEERRLRRAGRTLVKGDRRKIYTAARHRVQLQQDDRLAGLRARQAALQGELGQGPHISAAADAAKAHAEAANKVTTSVDGLVSVVRQMIGTLQVVCGELGSAEAAMKRTQ